MIDTAALLYEFAPHGLSIFWLAHGTEGGSVKGPPQGLAGGVAMYNSTTLRISNIKRFPLPAGQAWQFSSRDFSSHSLTRCVSIS